MAWNKDQPRVPAGVPAGGQFAKAVFESDSDVVADIDEVASGAGYAYLGIRIDDVETSEMLDIGDEFPESRVWIDGEPTSETVGGTSVLDIGDDSTGIGRALQLAGATSDAKYEGYFGKVMYLIGGDRSSAGEDPGEIVLENARVVGIYLRDTDAFAPINARLK